MESGGRKRGKADGSNGASAGGKRARESESFQTGVGSKSKPCTKFFSTAGCPFGEGCHFLHYFPGGHQAVAKMSGGPALANHPGRMPMGPAVSDGPPTPTVKTRLCNKYSTAEGCKWGDKCHFAHGERELGKHMFMDNPVPPPMGPRLTGHFSPHQMPTPGMATPASFGASATAKISVDASLAGAIIGRGGINTKQISRVTGAKLAIRDHESDTNLKNIELEGTFDQIKNASTMVRELIVSISGNAPPPAKTSGSHRGGGPRSNFKTKLCENFTKGSCTFGDRCHFAHGENQLRKSARWCWEAWAWCGTGEEKRVEGGRPLHLCHQFSSASPAAGAEMNSGPPDAASMPREEDGNNARRRITYSREFLLSVAASESCCDKLPAGIDAFVLSAMRWHWGTWDRCATAWRSYMPGAAPSPGNHDDDSSSRVERWVPRSRHRQRQGDDDDDDLRERAREPEASQTSAGGSKSKTCTRFFSTDGCRFGDDCRYLHYLPGDHHDHDQAVAEMKKLNLYGPVLTRSGSHTFSGKNDDAISWS